MARTSVTRTEALYTALRADILVGRLLPGSSLPFAVLCARYSASMGVIREGLSRLVEQGLVQAEPQHGFRVTSLSIDDLGDLTDARCAIESLALRLAIEHGDLAWEAQLVAAHHQLDRTGQMDPDDPDLFNEEWTRAHAAYHEASVAGCPNNRLRAIAASLRDAAELYRRWSRPIGHDETRDVPGEHRALLEAALARDADRAVYALTTHIRHTTEVLLAGAEQLDKHVSEST